ncbi:DUF4158 domain-containing protein [Glycomyces sp. L485]|nr:DUF4158 domain-containing protein [Glycomyces sp. L485]MCH7230310.1 DUF4158 domain-containing protein [Glycomyces sp. L485]
MSTRDVFSEAELEQLRRFPSINSAELIKYFTLTAADGAFLSQFRHRTLSEATAADGNGRACLGAIVDSGWIEPQPGSGK